MHANELKLLEIIKEELEMFPALKLNNKYKYPLPFFFFNAFLIQRSFQNILFLYKYDFRFQINLS